MVNKFFSEKMELLSETDHCREYLIMSFKRL